jgi:protein-disulfide isomerase
MILPRGRVRLALPVGPHDHVRGPAGAPVTLLEYGDYECPFCGRAQPIVEAVEQKLSGLMRLAFRHFPLSTVHPHAQQAAEAAEAAGMRGRFWDMHRLLFQNQPALSDDDLLHYASLLGLDVERFGKELFTHVHASRVREHFISGVRSGVNGTPAFFINGVRYDGPHEYESMLAELIDAIEAETRHGDAVPQR